ncbi:MAG: trypsin-like peptidase domain-containing protein [Pseudomonadota bacterium]
MGTLLREWKGLLIVWMLLVLALIGAKSNLYFLSSTPHTAQKVSRTSTEALRKSLPDFTELIEKEGPAVVNISASRSTKQLSGSLSRFSDDSSGELFRHFLTPDTGAQVHSMGSGFVIRSDGYILTNAHVVAAADKITVKFTDGRNYQAKLIGVDPLTDIALLKIAATGLTKVLLGNYSHVHVGEWVAAIGSPFGFENSVTAGIVSAKDRLLPGDTYVPFIQTDVAVNPGNSGGPLFNLRGEVIGINSQIYSQTGGYMGVSFSIPIDVAMDVSEQLRTTGKVVRGRLGIAIRDVPKPLAVEAGLPNLAGALIVGVEKSGPAEKGGLRLGDVALRYNRRVIANSFEMRQYMAATKPGDKTVIEIWRKGETKNVKIIAGELNIKK